MAAFGTEIIPETSSYVQASTIDALPTSVRNSGNQARPEGTEKSTLVAFPIRTYTRPQLLFLYNSPLIQLPHDMPELKDWFGDNDQNISKRDMEPTVPGNGRDRRFRRDAEDGELPPRPSFRSTLSQPSQMGNFKHQSLRSNDRDRDGEKDRQRDIRDKEGQEKLRHLSDKYDRERNKERDAAPHLAAGSSSRPVIPTQAPPGSSRRTDTREAMKKKGGEISEDWRRGAESRTVREGGSDVGRKDRSEREQPISRARDSSGPPRDPSNSRRDREDKDKDKFRNDRDRDDHKRQRDRDPEHRDGDGDDARRWRDDGKRDERMAARRGDKHVDQYRERDRVRDRESAWESSGDRRWAGGEERDGRPKRASGRERKNNTVTDEANERDDRRDREKEKEPAWMDAYIPLPSGLGILGSRGTDGELDGIQAWKKGMKEKELQDKATSLETKGENIPDQKSDMERSEPGEKQLDEIQLFKLLMKREEEKKHNDTFHVPLAEPNPPVFGQEIIDQTEPQPPQQRALHGTQLDPTQKVVEFSDERSVLPSGMPHSLSSLNSGGSSEVPSELPPTSQTNVNHSLQESAQSAEHILTDLTPQFNPPPGSRLLAFARTSSGNIKYQPIPQNSVSPSQGGPSNQGPPKSDTLRQLVGFAPFDDRSRTPIMFEDRSESNSFVHLNDGHRRGSGERAFPVPEENNLQDALPQPENGSGYSANKGSRFAKFFDGKGRENPIALPKAQTPITLSSSSPGPGQRQSNGNFIGSHGGPVDHRAIDDIYAMLSSSAQQSHRGASLNIPGTVPSIHAPFVQQPQNNTHFQHQQLQGHQHHLQSTRIEPVYESRLDDRNFVPDGMVPGLRSVPPPRSRENIGAYPEVLEDNVHFSIQRLPSHQPRGVDSPYPGPPPLIYAQQGGRNANIPLQQNQYRGGPSPNQPNSLQGSQQRLPPGLANLGGRPPHEPSQFMGLPGMPSMPSPGLHNALHLNGQSQVPFNTFNPSNNPGYPGSPQIRGPHPIQNTMGHHPAGMGHPSNLDIRPANQPQLVGIGGVNINALRGGFSGQGPPGQMPLLAMRQQQLPSHMLPPLLAPHLQQQRLSGPGNQPAHDLMALLMGGSHRE